VSLWHRISFVGIVFGGIGIVLLVFGVTEGSYVAAMGCFLLAASSIARRQR